MKKNVIFKSLALTFLLATLGCAADKYQSHTLEDELGQYDTSRHSADGEWWRGYHNNELNHLVETALQKNPDYLRAAININKELYNLKLQTLNLFPTLAGKVNASSQSEVNRTDNFSSNFSGELGLTYEVDLYGKIRNLQTAQEFEYKATEQDKESARLSLVNSVVDLYFNLTYLNNAIALTEKNIALYQNLYNISAQKYQSGKTDDIEYLQTRQSLLSEENKLLNLQTSFKEQESSLRNVLGAKPDEDLNLEFTELLEQKPLNVNMETPLAVLAKRPDLLASQYRLEKAFKNLKAEDKNWYPSISLKGAVNSGSDKARTTFDFPYLLGSVGVDLPFLDWNRVKNNVKISEADYNLALIDFKDNLNQALNEVTYYYFAYQKAGQQYDNVKQNYVNAVKISKYYQARYNNGKIEFKDYLEAINTENELCKTLIEQKYQIIKYENYIFKAMGGKYGA